MVWLFLARSASGSTLRSGAVKPVCEMAGADQRVLARDEAALLKRRAEVEGLLVPHDRAGIVMRHEVLARDLVKRESVGAGQFNGSIQRLCHGDSGEVSGEVVREDGLKQHGGQVDGLPRWSPHQRCAQQTQRTASRGQSCKELAKP